MSVENRPNLHAIALTLGILTLIDKNRRGNAKKPDIGEILELVREDIIEFVETVDEKLDSRYGFEVEPVKPDLKEIEE